MTSTDSDDRLGHLEAAVARLIRQPAWGTAIPDKIVIAEFLKRRDQEDTDPETVAAGPMPPSSR